MADGLFDQRELVARGKPMKNLMERKPGRVRRRSSQRKIRRIIKKSARIGATAWHKIEAYG